MRLRAGLAVFAAAVLAGCDSPADSDEQRYTLRSVAGVRLPAPDPASKAVDITAGALVLRDDGTLTEEMTVRCRSSLPPGTSCEVTNGGRSSREGTYSRAEGWVSFGPFPLPASFEDRRIVIQYGCPPSVGFSCPQFEARYER